jgi:hypothetical protein
VKGGLDLTKRIDKRGIFKNKPGTSTFRVVSQVEGGGANTHGGVNQVKRTGQVSINLGGGISQDYTAEDTTN